MSTEGEHEKKKSGENYPPTFRKMQSSGHSEKAESSNNLPKYFYYTTSPTAGSRVKLRSKYVTDLVQH